MHRIRAIPLRGDGESPKRVCIRHTAVRLNGPYSCYHCKLPMARIPLYLAGPHPKGSRAKWICRSCGYHFWVQGAEHIPVWGSRGMAWYAEKAVRNGGGLPVRRDERPKGARGTIYRAPSPEAYAARQHTMQEYINPPDKEESE